MAGVNTSNWVYAAWREQATAAERLTMLNQHLTEVSQAVVEQTHSEGRSQRINVSYLASLEDQAKDLRAAVNMGAAISRAGIIPTVVRPQF